MSKDWKSSRSEASMRESSDNLMKQAVDRKEKSERILTFENETHIFKVPCGDIAEAICDYYICQVDGEKKNSPSWYEAFDKYVEDKKELTKWLLNSTDPTDWENLTIEAKIKKTYEFWPDVKETKIV